MVKVADWVKAGDQRMLYFFNLRLRCSLLDVLLPRLTHSGGATFTIGCSLLIWLLGGPGLEGLLALGSSHLIVHFIKKWFTRERPFLQHEQVRVSGHLLHDYSFPSGHTTAICALTTTLALACPWLAPFLVLISMLVGLSRVYLGLHYPTDVLIGAVIGIGCALLTHGIIH